MPEENYILFPRDVEITLTPGRVRATIDIFTQAELDQTIEALSALRPFLGKELS